MTHSLENKIAIVTGSSKGIGAAIARKLASAGATVVVNYATSAKAADKVVADITSAGGKAIAIQADMSQAADIERLFKQTHDLFGKLDILVNNAGVYAFAPIEEVTLEHYHRMFNLNVLGLLLASQQAVKYFGDAGGNIINISSIVVKGIFPGTSVYSATKASVDAITHVLSRELGPRKIRVNAINPGMVETEGTHDAGISDSDMRKQVEAQTPLGRIGQPDDIASAALFLASDESSWITGQTHHISGGLI